VGTSYETMLVAAGMDEVRAVIAAVGSVAALVPVEDGRTAVIPMEGQHGYAETYDLATAVSGALGCPVATFEVAHSDVLVAELFRSGEHVHEYVSDRSAFANVYEDSDGEFKQELDGVVYPADVRLPVTPVGDDPTVFAPFAVGQPDLVGLATALSTKQLFAERQHWDILAALNLDPGGLTVAYRHLDDVGLAGVLHVGS